MNTEFETLRTENAEWKRIQAKTFTRWINERLKPADAEIRDLTTDLADGVPLIQLVQVLSGKDIRRYNKRARIRAQQMENAELALEFITKTEKIRLVNIGSDDIVDGHLKLILGLIWTLILHYAIELPLSELEEATDSVDKRTPRAQLLNWIHKKVSDLPINNFTTDWNDGKAIGALVDAYGPGLCSDWKSFDPETPLENIQKAMTAAEEKLGLPPVLAAVHMSNPNVDELSVMTYLSQFLTAKPLTRPPQDTQPSTEAAAKLAEKME